eukprot:m.835279 g.835279  ORF g.835279 m.835279 type:complete len:64 (-) comp23454_c0_seq3:30-221(-)
MGPKERWWFRRVCGCSDHDMWHLAWYVASKTFTKYCQGTAASNDERASKIAHLERTGAFTSKC